jgi:hypothetical protein
VKPSPCAGEQTITHAFFHNPTWEIARLLLVWNQTDASWIFQNQIFEARN